MNNIILNVGALLLGVGMGAVFILIILKNKKLFDIETKKEKAAGIIENSRNKADQLLKETKERVRTSKENLKHELDRRKERIGNIKESLKTREEALEKKQNRINQVKLALKTENDFLASAREAIKNQEHETNEKLAKLVGTSLEALHDEILRRYKSELTEEAEEKLLNIEENLKENANKKAKKLIVNVLQRLSSPTSVETKAVLVKVPKDHIKGKIVGKKGQNIVEFERNLEVDIIFNDLPKTISISGYNLVNRRIAKRAIQKLIKIRGAINKKVIKRTIEKAKVQVEEELLKIGREVVKKMNLKIKDKELIKTIGRLQFRTSYGQNIMKHSMEVAWVATMLGGELGLNVNTCKVGGFLHDLGKAIDQDPDIQGAHDYLTKELMEKFAFNEEEIHAAWTHHESEAPSTPEALIVQAADAVSACRPGARQESIDKYVERLQALEETARKFDGVKNTFAISAGRELRVIVDPEIISDQGIGNLAEDVSHKIEEDLSYPGTIKVNIIRRTHHTEIAK
ncbi:DUF3552 domain-containing protein [Candidatus Peregrinibacteria bacterium]|nr:DUF3552 domain-containing protein [Candidatus Peregrinibacteria bacterium]